jgi:hypothetical protein
VTFQLENVKSKIIASQKIRKIEVPRKSGFLDSQDDTNRSATRKKLNEVVEE